MRRRSTTARTAFLKGLIPAILLAQLSFGCSEAKGELVHSSASPDGRWEARTYRVDPGAMGSAWERVDVADTTVLSEPREIWRGPVLAEPPVWVDSRILRVDEVELEVDLDSYNWWEDRRAGLPRPQEAAAAYVTGIASGDIAAARRASRASVTRHSMREERSFLFGTAAELEVLDVSVSTIRERLPADEAMFEVQVKLSDEGAMSVHLIEVLCVESSGTWAVDWAIARPSFK